VQPLLAPLVGSTLTTVVVFAPLGLLSGVPGQFFRALSLSLSVAVLMSLALAVTLVPLMARWAATPQPASEEVHGPLDRLYGRLLAATIAHARLAVAAAVLLAAGTVACSCMSGPASSRAPTKAASCSIT
jgi:HAE1 family hydrophobic/amphiphilic exporter-1